MKELYKRVYPSGDSSVRSQVTLLSLLGVTFHMHPRMSVKGSSKGLNMWSYGNKAVWQPSIMDTRTTKLINIYYKQCTCTCRSRCLHLSSVTDFKKNHILPCQWNCFSIIALPRFDVFSHCSSLLYLFALYSSLSFGFQLYLIGCYSLSFPPSS